MASQENQTPDPAAQEQRKKVILGVVIGLLIFVLWWQDPFGLFTSEDVVAKGPVPAKTTATPKGSPTPSNNRPTEAIVSDPLKPELAFNKNTPLDGIGRNIFVYPTPTPLPPPPTPVPTPIPTPLPITLVGINPAGVIGKTGEFNLSVTGLKFPNDGRIFLEGREIQTRYVDESHLIGVVTGEMIRNPGNMGVQVRSASDANIYSNSIVLNVAEPPAPPYKFVGLIVSKQGTVAVLKSQTDDDVFNVRKGEIIGKPKRWEILSISAQRIELMDTQIKVAHSIAFTGDGGS